METTAFILITERLEFDGLILESNLILYKFCDEDLFVSYLRIYSLFFIP